LQAEAVLHDAREALAERVRERTAALVVETAVTGMDSRIQTMLDCSRREGYSLTGKAYV
jgi:hypothetical protein